MTKAKYEPRRYKELKNASDHALLVNSGMFFELFPELTGKWSDDKKIIDSHNKLCEEYLSEKDN